MFKLNIILYELQKIYWRNLLQKKNKLSTLKKLSQSLYSYDSNPDLILKLWKSLTKYKGLTKKEKNRTLKTQQNEFWRKISDLWNDNQILLHKLWHPSSFSDIHATPVKILYGMSPSKNRGCGCSYDNFNMIRHPRTHNWFYIIVLILFVEKHDLWQKVNRLSIKNSRILIISVSDNVSFESDGVLSHDTIYSSLRQDTWCYFCHS